MEEFEWWIWSRLAYETQCLVVRDEDIGGGVDEMVNDVKRTLIEFGPFGFFVSGCLRLQTLKIINEVWYPIGW